MKKILILLLCLFLTQNANAFCRPVKPRFSVRTNTGIVRYQTHLSREEFLKKAPTKMSPNTLGMTVSKLKITGNAEPDIQVGGGQVCVQVKKFNLILGYDVIDVYIDKNINRDPVNMKSLKNMKIIMYGCRRKPCYFLSRILMKPYKKQSQN